MKKYDIFISYKRKSLALANNLYYRLTARGFSTFFDLEELNRDNFDVQLLNYIENSKDVFVILEEGSLDACKQNNWSDDWFCKEIVHALKLKKNIIPILVGDYKMPHYNSLPSELKELSLKNAPEFSFSYFEEYLDRLIDKKYLISFAALKSSTTSFFKFYSDEDCQVFKDGKLVCCLDGMSDEPFYLSVPRKGEYRFKCVLNSGKLMIQDSSIDDNEEKIIHIKKRRLDLKKHSFIVFGGLLLMINVIAVFYYNYANAKSETPAFSKSLEVQKGNIGTAITEICKTQELVNENITHE